MFCEVCATYLVGLRKQCRPGLQWDQQQGWQASATTGATSSSSSTRQGRFNRRALQGCGSASSNWNSRQCHCDRTDLIENQVRHMACKGTMKSRSSTGTPICQRRGGLAALGLVALVAATVLRVLLLMKLTGSAMLNISVLRGSINLCHRLSGSLRPMDC